MSQAIFFDYANRLIGKEKLNRIRWARELKVTQRTITNFNKRLEREFGIMVKHSGGRTGYYMIDKQKSLKYNEFINFLQNLNSPTKIADAFQDSNRVGKHLIFHQDWNKISWMAQFNKILDAINKQKYINIDFFDFRTERKMDHRYFMPYWMKQNAYFRWYVIGFENEESSFPSVIGLDKILSIEIISEEFKRKTDLEKYRKEYENIFGIYIYEGRKPEKVRIEVTRFQAKYFKSLPLHPSQEIESENEEWTIFKYYLKINHEFAFELLRQNVWNFNINMLDFPHPKRTAVRILEPEWLVDYFYQTYKRAYLAYTKDLVILNRLKRDVDETEYPYPLPVF